MAREIDAGDAGGTKGTLTWSNRHGNLSWASKQLSEGLKVLLPCTGLDEDITLVELSILHTFEQFLHSSFHE